MEKEKKTHPRPREKNFFKKLRKQHQQKTTNAVYNLTVGKVVNATVYKVSLEEEKKTERETNDLKTRKERRKNSPLSSLLFLLLLHLQPPPLLQVAVLPPKATVGKVNVTNALRG